MISSRMIDPGRRRSVIVQKGSQRSKTLLLLIFGRCDSYSTVFMAQFMADAPKKGIDLKWQRVSIVERFA